MFACLLSFFLKVGAWPGSYNRQQDMVQRNNAIVVTRLIDETTQKRKRDTEKLTMLLWQKEKSGNTKS
jgi:hypothetical protein